MTDSSLRINGSGARIVPPRWYPDDEAMYKIRQKPEVLAPAGSPESLRAAVAAGADAVYFGLTDWNARIRARNFELGDLPDTLRDLRRWGVRSYLTFNTLVFTEEREAARDAIEAIALAGPDGIIVQDLGMIRLIREVAPGLPIHASTQMTLSSPGGLALVSRLGVTRVILARELTLSEIGAVVGAIRRESTSLECEIFVHGALCVSWSGQCLSSEAWGGRSANRGQCAQACRLPYDLIVDGRREDLGDRAYLLSPRDLEGYRRIPELTALGIAAFKIEGRMKSAEYVASATALYRAAVDQAWGQVGGGPDSHDRAGSGLADRAGAALPDRTVPVPTERVASGSGRRTDPRPRGRDSLLARLAAEAGQIFSRGESEGFLGGVNHQKLVDGMTRSHRGLPAGHVVGFERDRAGAPVAVLMEPVRSQPGRPAVRLAAGDGVLFAVSALEEDEVGGRLSAVEVDGVGESPSAVRKADRVLLRFPRASMPDLVRVRPGTPVFRTSQPTLIARLDAAIARPESARQVPLSMKVEARLGEPLRVEVRDPEGRTIKVRSGLALEPAARNAIGGEMLRAQLGRLGGTRYRLADLEADLEPGLFLPVSELNRMRREAVERLEVIRGARPVVGEPVAGAVDGTSAAPGRSAQRSTRPSADTNEPPDGRPEPGAPSTSASPILWAVERADLRGRALAPGRNEGGQAPASVRAPAPPPTDFEDRFVILVRNREQMSAAVRSGARRLALDFLDLVGLREASAELADRGIRRTLALPRVQKPGEERIESFFLGLRPEEILVRSLGGLERLRRLRAETPDFPKLAGDVSLNAVNPDSLDVLWGLGLDRVTPGLDLNGEQLERLVEETDATRLEVPVHQHLPVFHTEHCVFAAFLSDGADFRSCGRPCDRHRIALRDRTGQTHPVIADVGCRNTVFGARPLSMLPHSGGAPERRRGRVPDRAGRRRSGDGGRHHRDVSRGLGGAATLAGRPVLPAGGSAVRRLHGIAGAFAEEDAGVRPPPGGRETGEKRRSGWKRTGRCPSSSGPAVPRGSGPAKGRRRNDSESGESVRVFPSTSHECPSPSFVQLGAKNAPHLVGSGARRVLRSSRRSGIIQAERLGGQPAVGSGPRGD